MSKHTSIVMASIFVASLFVVSHAEADSGRGRSYRSSTIRVQAQVKQSSVRTQRVLKKIATAAVQNDSTLRNKATRTAFKTRSTDRQIYLNAAEVQVTSVKLDMGKRTSKGQSLKGMEFSVKVKSPAGNRTRTAKVKVGRSNDRYMLEDFAAALEVEFGK